VIPLEKNWSNGLKKSRACDVLIVTGFIARNLEGMPVTLKRNGSDFSATIFSVLTSANSVTIWKDVDGMFTADPKKHPGAIFIPEQTFEEAEEASRRGAFVIQADCIEPAKNFNIPIFLRNCFKLECPGTRIGRPLPKKPEITRSVEEIVAIEEHREPEAVYAVRDDEIPARRRSSAAPQFQRDSDLYPSCSETARQHTTSPGDLEIIV